MVDNRVVSITETILLEEMFEGGPIMVMGFVASVKQEYYLKRTKEILKKFWAAGCLKS